MKTGCLVTADGSDDNLIQPEGTVNYSFKRIVVPANTSDEELAASALRTAMENAGGAGASGHAAAAEDDDDSDSSELDLGIEGGDEGEVDVGGPPQTIFEATDQLAESVFGGVNRVRFERILDVPAAVDASLKGRFVVYRYNVSYGWVAGKVLKVGKVSRPDCNVEVKWADGDTGVHMFSCSEYAGGSIEFGELDDCAPGTWFKLDVSETGAGSGADSGAAPSDGGEEEEEAEAEAEVEAAA